MKKLFYAAAGLGILILLAVAANYTMSPPGAGEEIAGELEVVHPAVIAHRGLLTGPRSQPGRPTSWPGTRERITWKPTCREPGTGR